jgi:hypothetical protein
MPVLVVTDLAFTPNLRALPLSSVLESETTAPLGSYYTPSSLARIGNQ